MSSPTTRRWSTAVDCSPPTARTAGLGLLRREQDGRGHRLQRHLLPDTLTTPPPWRTRSDSVSRRTCTGSRPARAEDGHQHVPARSVDGALRAVRPPARGRGPGRQLPGRALRCRPPGQGQRHPGRAVEGSALDALRAESFTANAGYRAAVSPFVTNEEVGALFATGDTASALSLVQKLWGYMDAPGPDYSGADWELVGTNGAPGFGDATSLAHGWSSGATADLSSYVLGVHTVHGRLPDLVGEAPPGLAVWVEGDVPTPHGSSTCASPQDGHSGRLAMQVSAPGGTGARSVPVLRSGTVVTVAPWRPVVTPPCTGSSRPLRAPPPWSSRCRAGPPTTSTPTPARTVVALSRRRVRQTGETQADSLAGLFDAILPGMSTRRRPPDRVGWGCRVPARGGRTPVTAGRRHTQTSLASARWRAICFGRQPIMQPGPARPWVGRPDLDRHLSRLLGEMEKQGSEPCDCRTASHARTC